MSTNALATLGDIPTSKYGPEDNNKDDFVKGVEFHPRIQFFSDQATICKKKQFPANHFALVVKKDEMKDLGESFVCMPLGYRYKALDFREKGKVRSFYDPKSPDFLAVKEEAERKRPPGEKSQCMAGVEFLLYVQNHGYATLLCSSASLKKVAKKLFAMVKQYVQFGHRLVESGSFIYEAPDVSSFSGSFDIADPKLVKIVTDFINQSASKVEDTEEGDGETAPGATTGDRVR
jgi:hypothetical protein